MLEIDPWALPQGGAGTAGIPGAPAPFVPLAAARPVSRVLPILVMALAAAYTVMCVVEIFIVNSQVSLAHTLDAAIASGSISDDQIAQANASDHHITTGSWTAAGIYFAALIAFIVWQRKLRATLGSVGASRAVLKKAGHSIFQWAWALSFLLGIFLNTQTNNSDINSMQDVINHDHELMLYFGLRALLGVVLVFFAYRLMRISEDGVAHLRAISLAR